MASIPWAFYKALECLFHFTVSSVRQTRCCPYFTGEHTERQSCSGCSETLSESAAEGGSNQLPPSPAALPLSYTLRGCKAPVGFCCFLGQGLNRNKS